MPKRRFIGASYQKANQADKLIKGQKQAGKHVSGKLDQSITWWRLPQLYHGTMVFPGTESFFLTYCFFLKETLFYAYDLLAHVCVCLCVGKASCVCLVLTEADEGDGSSGTGTVDICELPHGCREANSGTRQEELKVCVTIHNTGS